MTSARRSILIGARVNGRPGAHRLAPSVLKLTEHTVDHHGRRCRHLGQRGARPSVTCCRQ